MPHKRKKKCRPALYFYKYFTFFVLYFVLGQPKKIENYNRMPWSSILDFEWQFLRHKSCLRIFRNKKKLTPSQPARYFVWVRGQTTQAKQKSDLFRDQLISFYIFRIFDTDTLAKMTKILFVLLFPPKMNFRID